ncbi:hypothetical protein CBR_g40397 [Chara braunii]|uniref:Reverse transcriptase domain-containing protein n=1 Tax=Chara braunii TaxID=69332 RepID=A0A388LTT0_CHABU|nr:hypothetical protein CBR_g40397 [Chara braunii]|eukprot:GBG85665.1 hypothetical protein CBR_g40397 [Chara braunii]
MINGHLSEPFPLTRSLRQGCPLAPLIFVLQLEVLLNKIRSLPIIRGLQLHTGNECKVKVLADDLFAVCENSEPALTAMNSVLCEYSTLSEASVNWCKSTYLLPAQFELKVEWGMKRVAKGEEERFLGMLISLQIEASSQGLLLQQRIAARLRIWGSAWHLSLIGRALVANAALFSILWFVTTVIELADGMARAIRKLVARFLWKPRAQSTESFISKVALDTLSFPREKGGLGLVEPTRKNQAQLLIWVKKAAGLGESEHWVALAERILMGEWKLSRPKDVWACFFMPSFRKKRLCSGFWEPIRRAWKRMSPNSQSTPTTKEEVLNQLLFENPVVVDSSHTPFLADGKPGTFGRATVRRGVVKMEDIWSLPLRGWIPLRELKLKLRGLQRTEEHWHRLIEAIPLEWLDILGPDGIDPTSTMSQIRNPEEIFSGRYWKSCPAASGE